MKQKTLKLSLLFLLTGLLAFPKKNADDCKMACELKCAEAKKNSQQVNKMSCTDASSHSTLAPGYCLLIID